MTIPRINLKAGRGPAAALTLSLMLAGCVEEATETVQAAEIESPEIVTLSPEQLASAGLATATVETRPIGTLRRVPGTVITPDTALAVIGSVVEGRVNQVRVVAGDRVAAGTELMRLHSHELTDAIRDLASANANLAYYSSALERSRLLLEAGAVSREEVERREADYEAALAEASRSEEWVEHLTPSPDGDVIVRAPRSGVVFAVHARPGAVVTPGTPLVELGSTDVLWVQGHVPEASAARLETGATVRVGLSSLPGVELSGRIVRMGEIVDPVRRAVDVRIELGEVPPAVRPGMYATLLIPEPGGAERATLPGEAVQRVGGEEFVFVQEQPGRYRAVLVRSEDLGDGQLAVDGVQAGAMVVTRGAYTLRSLFEGIEAE